ncbi:MAG TPA: NUDIX domain-containing protein [Candidatus Nanoarchaeia archaeon]|nr:NUDIX domain-containing protein [Candidatus Nanoarchaeia archaeon]
MNQKKTVKQKNPTKPARATREYTAGGVVFRRSKNGIELLMIQDPKERWTIPKGHVEEGERLEQTALREVEEETGLKNLKIRDKLDKIHFFYRKEGKLIFMTTYIFLMEAVGNASDELVPEEWMNGIQWFPANKAIELIEYRDTEKLFKLGLSKIK